MRRLLTLLALGLLAAIGSYVVVRSARPPADDVAATTGSDITWLKAEFKLTDAQFEAIRAVHATYAESCAVHCSNIVAAHLRRDTLRASNAARDELAAAERELQSLEAVCNDATRVHVRHVAGLMPPEQGRRYLELIEPHLASLPHDGARGLSR